MSSAFVKESEEQWLHDILPTLPALVNYLTRENNGIRVYEKSAYTDARTGRQMHVMSNGFIYILDNDNRWCIVD